MELGQQIKKLAPRATILNYTNPMATLTKTLTLVTPQPVVGLCHGVYQNFVTFGKIFGAEEKGEVEVT